MLVRYRMSPKVVVAQPQQSIADARAVLSRRRIRQLPVMRGKQLVGIVTDRDLRAAPRTATAVKDVMSAKLITITPDVPVDEAARLMRKHRINALPVTEKTKLVGILTATDVLTAFIDLSGVAEATYHLTLASDARPAAHEIRDVIARTHGEVKWIHPDEQRRNVVHLRLKARRIDDVVSALEGAGYEVDTMAVPGEK